NSFFQLISEGFADVLPIVFRSVRDSKSFRTQLRAEVGVVVDIVQRLNEGSLIRNPATDIRRAWCRHSRSARHHQCTFTRPLPEGGPVREDLRDATRHTLDSRQSPTLALRRADLRIERAIGLDHPRLGCTPPHARLREDEARLLLRVETVV